TPDVFSFASGGGPTGTLPDLSAIVATGDILGNGNFDLLWLGAHNTPESSGTRGGSPAETLAPPAPPSPWSPAGAADPDGYGKSDILWQNADGAVRIWDVDRNGTIATAVPGNPGAAWQLTGATDVNGDGMADLLFTNAAENQEQVWLMNGT